MWYSQILMEQKTKQCTRCFKLIINSYGKAYDVNEITMTSYRVAIFHFSAKRQLIFMQCRGHKTFHMMLKYVSFRLLLLMTKNNYFSLANALLVPSNSSYDPNLSPNKEAYSLPSITDSHSNSHQ